MIRTALLGFFIQLSFHFGSHGIFLCRVGEAAQTVKPHRLDEITQFGVLLFRFAGEAGNQGSAQRNTGNRLPQAGNGVLDLSTAAAAVHRLEHRIIAMLNGQVQIRHHLGIAHHGLDKRITDPFGVRIENPNPADAVDLLQVVQQLTDGTGFTPVLAVGCGVLGYQDQLPHPFTGQPAGFGHTVLQRTAAKRTANHGNGAIVAAVVASLGNFQVGIMLGRGDDPRTAQRHIGLGAVTFHLTGACCTDPSHNGRQRRVGTNAHYRVDLGDFLHDLLLVTFRQAAGNDHFEIWILLFVLAGHENVLDGFGLGRLNKAAGVDDNHIRFGRVGNRRVPVLEEGMAEHIRVHLVFGAAQRNNGNLHRYVLIV